MTWDPVWETVFQSREWGKYPSERVIRYVAINFYNRWPRRAVRLLDLGCGPGASTWFMAREGFSVSGIDGSQTGVERAMRRLSAEGLTAELQVGDFTTLPWKDGWFDGVIDNAALYANSYKDCVRTVSEVRRVLKSGGSFLSCNFTPQTWGYGLGREVETGGFTDIGEGPLAHKGFSLFMDRSQIEHLYQCFEKVAIDTESMTIGGGAHMVESWVVTCKAV